VEKVVEKTDTQSSRLFKNDVMESLTHVHPIIPLLMPPAGSLMLMALFLMFFRLFVPAMWFEPFCAFFIIGYLVYDYIHYATHFFPMRSALPRLIKKHHMQHHFTDPNRYYGVSSPLWDSVFKTG